MRPATFLTYTCESKMHAHVTFVYQKRALVLHLPLDLTHLNYNIIKYGFVSLLQNIDHHLVQNYERGFFRKTNRVDKCRRSM